MTASLCKRYSKNPAEEFHLPFVYFPASMWLAFESLFRTKLKNEQEEDEKNFKQFSGYITSELVIFSHIYRSMRPGLLLMKNPFPCIVQKSWESLVVCFLGRA